MNVAARLQRAWTGRGALALALLPAALCFRGLAAARLALYRCGVLATHRVDVPVVIVGGIMVGGTGKTPLVIHLARALREQGFHPGVISRGYGGRASTARAVGPDDDPRDVGDEPLVIARGARCPVWIGRDRAAAARALLAAVPGCDVLVADDGLQHYALARDVEVAVIDARGFGNGFLLPAGPLREPVGRLSQVDAIVSNGGRWPDAMEACAIPAARFSMSLEAREFARVGRPGERAGAERFRGVRVHAVAGIGDPSRFFAQLRGLGIDVREHAFPDHHRFSAEDLRLPDCDAILMTEKDAVKCEAFAPAHAWFLSVQARLEPDLARHIAERLHGRTTARNPRLPDLQGPAGAPQGGA